MTGEESEFVNWIRERREAAPGADEDFSADVMERIRRIEAAPSIETKVAAMVRRLVPERKRREAFCLGGSALAGSLRLVIILYLVVGVC